MLDQRLVVLLEAPEHARLKQLASERGVSAASLVRDAIRQILEADARGALMCREGSPSYGADFDDALLDRLRGHAERQGCSVTEFLTALLDEQTEKRLRREALERLRERMKRGLYEVGEIAWSREELHER